MKLSLGVFKPAVMLTIFCVIITAALALTNLVTKDTIAIREKEAVEAAMKSVCEADEYIEMDGGEYYVAKGKETCYIFTGTASGYGGDVKVMTGILPDGTIKKIEVVDVTSETVGLGQNAKNDTFKSQFDGKSGALSVVKNSPNDNEIQAVTGATITSRAVTKCVNDALEKFNSLEITTGGADNG